MKSVIQEYSVATAKHILSIDQELAEIAKKKNQIPTKSISDVISLFESFLPKWMVRVDEYYCQMATQVALNIFRLTGSRLGVHKFYVCLDKRELPLQLSLEKDWLDNVVGEVLDFIEAHQNKEEEIHLAPDYCLLRFESKWAAGGQEDLIWTDREYLINNNVESAVHSLNEVFINCSHNVAKCFRIHDGNRWHQIDILINDNVCQEFFLGSLHEFKLID